MLGSKYITSFEPKTVNANNAISDIHLEYTCLLGEYMIDENGNIEVYSDGVSSTAFIYATLDADYYILSRTYNKAWSNKVVDGENVYYIENASDLNQYHIDGYENTKALNKLYGNNAIATMEAASVDVLSSMLEWYLPSYDELETISYSNKLNYLLSGKNLWTSNLKDDRNAWVYSNNNAIEGNRLDEKNIIIFGRRKL